jgi:hypothetical protein
MTNHSCPACGREFGVEQAGYLSGLGLVEVARSVAFEVHFTQARTFGPDKGCSCFDTHLRRVHAAVRDRCPENYEAQAVAWLHDGMEDHPSEVTLDALKKLRLPPVVIDGIVAMTQNKDSGEGYVPYLKRAFRNPLSRIVKLEDMVDNATTLTPSARETTMTCKYALGIELFTLWGEIWEGLVAGRQTVSSASFFLTDVLPTVGDYLQEVPHA